jgi:asparagine synthase (glutamine-hydrolysing)
MSGVAALFQRDGAQADRGAVDRMLDAIPYRGPDGSSTWEAGPIALGHARMVVTPEDVDERQPLVRSQSGCAISADVRLDNREELGSRLGVGSVAGVTDAELILLAYERWGLDAPVHLLGDFAFVLWDPARQHVVCARDTSGQRSLFYRATRTQLACASEIQQLFQDPSVPLAVNEERVRTLLVPFSMGRNEADSSETFYDGVDAVPAGHLLVVDRQSATLRRYWALTPPPELRYSSPEAYVEHSQDLFFPVGRRRPPTAHPIAATLSGGLDSSSIVCTAQELFRAGRAVDRGFMTFSGVFDDLDCDERDRIGDSQAKYGFDARYVPMPTVASWLRSEPRGFQESPTLGVPELRETYYGAIAETGARVVLTGEIADACILGSPFVFDSLLRQGKLREMWTRLRAYQRTSPESLRHTLALHVLAPLLPPVLRYQVMSFSIRRTIARERDFLLPRWIAQPLRDELIDRHTAAILDAEQRRPFASPAREQEYRLLNPPEVARHPVPFPLEVWRPFADRRLHELLLAVPPEEKYSPDPTTDSGYAASKQLLRKAMRGILPESVRTLKDKIHFGSIFTSSVQQQWPMYEATFGPAARPEVVERGYVDHKRFWSRLGYLREGIYGQDFMYVLHILHLEAWLRGLRMPRPQAVTVPPPWRPSAGIQGGHAPKTPVGPMAAH